MARNGDLSIPTIHHKAPHLQASTLALPGAESDGLIYIEQFHAGAENCQSPNRPYLQAVNHQHNVAVLFQPACKLWGCPVCGPRNKRRWIARAIHGITALRGKNCPVGFLTLTSHEKLRKDASWRVFPAAWKKLYARWQRAAGDQHLAYMAVPERHKDGSLHTHMIVTGSLPERWWKDNARACGMGYMADLQEVVDLGVGGYVGKYLGKTLDEKWPKNKRRINVSHSWPKLPEMPGLPEWEFAKLPSRTALNQHMSALEKDGYDVTIAGSRGAWGLVAEIERIYADRDE